MAYRITHARGDYPVMFRAELLRVRRVPVDVPEESDLAAAAPGCSRGGTTLVNGPYAYERQQQHHGRVLDLSVAIFALYRSITMSFDSVSA